jgi:hypothetical protein
MYVELDHVRRVRAQLPGQDDAELCLGHGAQAPTFGQHLEERDWTQWEPVFVARQHVLLWVYFLGISDEFDAAAISAGEVL